MNKITQNKEISESEKKGFLFFYFYILESLLGAPPVTLATRRRASSALRSFSWFKSSAFDFPLNSWTLILAEAEENERDYRDWDLGNIEKLVEKQVEVEIFTHCELLVSTLRLLLNKPQNGGGEI